MNRFKLLLSSALVAACVQTSWGAVYGFEVLENNSPIDLAPQLYMDVTDNVGNVTIRIGNAGPAASTIASIFFDTPSNLITLVPALSVSYSNAGISFSVAAGGNLPGGNNVGFSSDGVAHAANPKPHNGVNPGEWVEFVFATNGSVVDALSSNPAGMRVGLHVISLADGQSETYVNTRPPTNVPDSASTLALLGLGLGALGFVARRRKA